MAQAGWLVEDEHGPTSYKALLEVPGLAQLLGSAVFARTATRMISVTLVLFVLDVYHSPTLSGIVVLTSLLPGMIFSPFAGALLDRRGRLLLIGTDYFVGGATFSLITALSLLGDLPRGLLLVIVGIGALTQPLSNAGTRSLIPAMVPRPLWDRANAIDSTGYVIANVCGPAIGGAAVALFGPRGALLLPAGALALAALLLIGLKVPEMPSAAQHSIRKDALDGLRYVWNHVVLRNVGITLSLYFGATGVLSIAVPLIIEHRLHMGSVAVGASFAVAGGTGFVAGIVAGRIGTAGKEHRIFATAGLVNASAIVALSFTHEIVLVFVMLGVTGATNGPLTVAMFSLRQRITDPEWFGRAFAVSMTLNGMGNPIGAAVCGVLAAHSITLGAGFGALLALVAGMLALLRPDAHREQRALGEVDRLAAGAPEVA